MLGNAASTQVKAAQPLPLPPHIPQSGISVVAASAPAAGGRAWGGGEASAISYFPAGAISAIPPPSRCPTQIPQRYTTRAGSRRARSPAGSRAARAAMQMMDLTVMFLFATSGAGGDVWVGAWDCLWWREKQQYLAARWYGTSHRFGGALYIEAGGKERVERAARR